MKFKNESNSGLCNYGFSHRSKLERAVCSLIWFREKAKELKHVQHEDHILLGGWYTYVADFKCKDMKTGQDLWIEAKGYADHRWPSTKKGWKYCGPGTLEVWGGTYTNPKITEIIIPKGTT